MKRQDVTVTLRSVTPCCQHGVRFRAFRDVPREVYERTCPGCGTRYDVTRTTASDTGDTRIDLLDWEATSSPRKGRSTT